MKFIDVSAVHSDALSLKTLLDQALARTIAVFTEYNVPLPARQYWMMGPSSVDGEQLCVSLTQMYLGLPGDEAHIPQRGNAARSAVLNIAVSRDVPVVSSNGKPPTPEEMTMAANISAVDSWVLLELTRRLDMWDPDASAYGMGVIATIEAPVQEGGFSTVNMTVTLVIP